MLLLVAAGMASTAFAQVGSGDGGTDQGGIPTWVEYGKRIEATQQISALEDGFAGESVSLYNGATTFTVTDIDIPGNSKLPVRLARRLAIELQPQDQIQPYDSLLHGVGNWDVDVPYMAATYPTSTGWNSDRCSTGSVPPTAMGPEGLFWRSEVWQGITIHVPGRGDATALGLDSQVPVPSSGGPYRLTTTNRDAFDCIPMKSGLSGEGFRMTTTDGVRYYFDVGTTRTASKLVKYIDKLDGIPGKVPIYLERNRYYLLASKIEDRFGNTVQFQYDANGHPTHIWSNDGRDISLTYSGGRLSSATSGGRTWQYQYDASGNLTTVVLPDTSHWQYAYSGTLMPAAPAPNESLPLPWCQGFTAIVSDEFILTATHPSGAVATFQFDNTRHFRSGVHASECVQVGDPANPSYDLLVPYFFDVMSLTQKTLSGPGLPTATWQYTYDYGTPPSGLWGSHTDPANYPCTTCAQYKTVTVSNPDGSKQRYRFGMVYWLNDGRLLQTDTLRADGSVIRTETSDYLTEAAAGNQPFYPQYGHVLGGVADPVTERIRPVVQSQITQDGTTFTTTTNAFDGYARATTQTESSSLGYSRVDQTTYHDNTANWVLGQVAQRKVNGIVAASTTFDATTALPLTFSSFGKLKQTLTWNPDGTLASVKDGNNHVTTASEWKRGIPQLIGYADGTHESAVVNDDGWITSVTDENGFTTNYGYDAMGRLASITYPAGDDVAWNPTLLSFAPVAGSEYGIPAGHWKQTVHTGSGYTVTYFDAMWRPLVKEQYDSANKAATLSQTVQRYDTLRRKVFESYPTNVATSYTQSLPGTATSYDALNRVTQVLQDSEIGSLPTTTEYQAGFKTKVTNPNGYSTVTSYQAFGKPDTSQPVNIAMPEGVTTTIVRDAFGKPLSITRSGSYGGSTISSFRTFVYDANQLLCKRIEPETGATLFAYDGADNLAWSAPGTSLTGNTCDRGSVTSGQMITRSYDARNRLLSVVYPDGVSNTEYTYAADGAMLSAVNHNGSDAVQTVYAYDKRRLLIGEAVTVPGANPFAIGYGYDANGHLGSLSYPDGRILTFVPNALGQPTQAGSYATGVSYYPNGAIKQFNYGDGSVHTLTQNLRGLPERSLDSLGATPVLDNTSAYDSDGNVAAITDGLSGNVGNIDMSYDGLDRLITATSPMFAGNHQASFTYDPLDNLRSAGVGNGNQYAYSYDYSSTRRLVSMTGSQTFDFGYDARGNLTARNAQVYTFDMADRLRAANGLESYLYDAAGRRVRKSNLLDGTLTYYAYDKAGSLLYEWDPATMNANDYVYLGGSLVAKVTKDLSPPPPPATPASISVPASSSTGSVTVSWASSDGATSYTLQQQLNGGSWTQAYSGSATSKALSGLGDGSYKYRVQACNGNGCSGWRTSGTLTVALVPAMPASISVPTSSSNGSVTVSWASSSLATSYTLQQQLNGGSWTQAYSGSATSKALSGLGDGSYKYRVQACNGNGCSGWRTSGTLTVAWIPATPSSITVPASSLDATIAVSWSASSHASSYVLYQSFNSGSWSQVYSGSASSRTVTVSASGSYKYEVKACGAGGCSGYKVSSTVAVTLKPASAPHLTGPATSSSGTFTLSWTAVSGTTSYHLHQALNGTDSLVSTAGATTWSSSNLGNGSYAYHVYACNAAGCSASSNTVTVTVTHPPAAPASVTVPLTAKVGTPFTVSWSAVTGATRYELRQTLEDDGSVSTPYSGSGTAVSITLNGPEFGEFQYAARACNGGGCSGWTQAPHPVLLNPGSPGGPIGLDETPASGGTH